MTRVASAAEIFFGSRDDLVATEKEAAAFSEATGRVESSRIESTAREDVVAAGLADGRVALFRVRDDGGAWNATLTATLDVSRGWRHLDDIAARAGSNPVHATTATLFTVAATRIVLDEEYSYDNEGGETPLARELTQFLSERPVGRDGDGWLRALLRESHTLRLAALRIIELRESYAREDFDFERVRVTAMDEVKTANDALMVGYVQRSM